MSLDYNSVIQKVVNTYAPGSIALALTGSFARGTPSPHSDLDIIRYVTAAELSSMSPYQLLIIDEQLVSLSQTCIESITVDLHQPRRFFLVKPSLEQCIILYDPNRQLECLVNTAKNLDWSNLGELSRSTISSSLAGFVEEVTKLLTGLHESQPWTCLYAIEEVLFELSELMIIYHQAYLQSENQFFLVPQQVAGIESNWSKNFRSASGVLAASTDIDIVTHRSRAALSLYVETCRIMHSAIIDTDRLVTDWGLKLIQDYLAFNTESTILQA